VWQTDAGQKMVQAMPRKRVGKPADLDAALMMLCSNQSGFINGSVISADDGQAI
jgi:NAD(P)-dependent dehydrogenase (short-subunit alcohol dehydrogenase family)